MEQRVTMITLGVSNLKKSTEFYKTIFGWTMAESSNEHISFFTLNGMQLALYHHTALAKDANVNPDGNGFKGFTLSHNMRSEEAVDHLLTNFKTKDVKIIKEAQKTDWGGYSGYIADPDGHLWEIAFNPYLALDTNGHIKV